MASEQVGEETFGAVHPRATRLIFAFITEGIL